MYVGGGSLPYARADPDRPARHAGEEMQKRAGMAMPMRRIGQVQEIAAAVVWLCSDQASYITGVTLPIDGGKLAGMAPFGQGPAPTPPHEGSDILPRPSTPMRFRVIARARDVPAHSPVLDAKQ